MDLPQASIPDVSFYTRLLPPYTPAQRFCMHDTDVLLGLRFPRTDDFAQGAVHRERGEVPLMPFQNFRMSPVGH
jgi:hypothetical protein